MAAVKDFALYLPDGGISELWGAEVTACGMTRIVPGASSYPPNPRQHPGDHLFWLPRGGRILDSYQLLYVSAGEGHFESVATGCVEVKSGMAFLLFPKVWHRYAPLPEVGWTEHFIELRGPLLDRLKGEGILRPKNAVFSPGVSPELIETFDTLHRLFIEGQAGAREQMAMLGMHLLAQVVFSRKTPALSAEERAVRQAELRMRENLGECVPMTGLARECGISYDRFRRAFKALTGLAPKHYYRKLQMRRAEELLLHTRRGVSEIADELDFHSAFHLSAAFKDHSGHAPSHWRELRVHVRD